MQDKIINILISIKRYFLMAYDEVKNIVIEANEELKSRLGLRAYALLGTFTVVALTALALSLIIA
tara:strand:+ start:423 stop:617 length:195 start_codon:yes stop_codon:yes gene_type:complete